VTTTSSRFISVCVRVKLTYKAGLDRHRAARHVGNAVATVRGRRRAEVVLRYRDVDPGERLVVSVDDLPLDDALRPGRKRKRKQKQQRHEKPEKSVVVHRGCVRTMGRHNQGRHLGDLPFSPLRRGHDGPR
jgi:hypothetical protein